MFPLGMCTAATLAYAHAVHAPFLLKIPSVTMLIAFAAWLLASVGMLRAAFRYFL